MITSVDITGIVLPHGETVYLLLRELSHSGAHVMNMDHALKPGDLTFIELRIEADQLDELPEQSELLL